MGGVLPWRVEDPDVWGSAAFLFLTHRTLSSQETFVFTWIPPWTTPLPSTRGFFYLLPLGVLRTVLEVRDCGVSVPSVGRPYWRGEKPFWCQARSSEVSCRSSQVHPHRAGSFHPGLPEPLLPRVLLTEVRSVQSASSCLAQPPLLLIHEPRCLKCPLTCNPGPPAHLQLFYFAVGPLQLQSTEALVKPVHEGSLGDRVHCEGTQES